MKNYGDLFNKSLDAIKHDKIAVAVSGGADSTALLYMLSNWVQKHHSGIKLVVFNVNHGLRKEAEDEAELVRQHAVFLGHEFHSLYWQEGAGVSSALQEQARQARYDLMSKKCHDLRIKLLFTAHHRDDLLETYLMRKSKKSGIFGLSYSDNFFYNEVQIFRPLLHMDKQQLLEYLQHNAIDFLEDASNKSDKYERNRIRKKIHTLSHDKKQQLIEEMQQCNLEAHELNDQLLHAMAEFVRINHTGFAEVDFDGFCQQVYEIRLQIISYLLTVVGGKQNLPRHRNMQHVLQAISLGKSFKSSLHGCIIKLCNDTIIIYREKSDIEIDAKILSGGIVWDNRFHIGVNHTDEEMCVSSLSHDEYVIIKAELDSILLHDLLGKCYKSVLFTLPVIKKLEKIIAIPHISYYDREQFCSNDVEVTFRPNFISRFTHFL